jgi:hypothetical protein
MCNAWNHSASCTCGWGGEGHLGRSLGNSGLNGMFTSIVYKTYRELLIGATYPNASCPVCGIKVFFYKSPHGGRVFFDELGPPWPKHSCTDNKREVRLLNLLNVSNIEFPVYQNTDGWQPFLCEDITYQSFDKGVAKITGILVDAKKIFFVRQEGLTVNSPFFIKIQDSYISISTVVYVGKEIKAVEARIFDFESEIHSLMPEIKKPRSLMISVASGQERPTVTGIKKRKSSNKPLMNVYSKLDSNDKKNSTKSKPQKRGSLSKKERMEITKKIQIEKSIKKINEEKKLNHKLQDELEKYLSARRRNE